MVLVEDIFNLLTLLVLCKPAPWKCKEVQEPYSEWYKMLLFRLVQQLVQPV